tara:strand:+ start:347 stop:2245 length:1899 start_codon:yes stop_codon:yes gene_type:complete
MDLFVDAVEIVIDAAADGEKLGVINYDNDVKNNSIYSSHNLNKKDNNWRYQTELKTPGSIPLNFIEASLLFRVLEYVVDEFRHYCGETGIDPTGTGKCLDDFGWLREDYLMLRETLLQHINSGLPVEDFLEPGQLELINLTPKITTESVMRTLMTNNPKWWKEVGSGLLKENKEEKNNIRTNILKETYKLVISKIPINEHKSILNPEIEPGDVVELIYMDDPWHPIPVATRGVVVGFDSVGTIGEKILVRWIINNEEGQEEFKNVPMLPDVDVWRKVEIYPQLDEQQQIQYDKVLSPKRYGNKEYVYFKGTDSTKSGESEKIILSGPNGEIILDSMEVSNAKFGGLQVNYNRETQQEIDKLFSYEDLNKGCEFTNAVLRDGGKWEKSTGDWRNKTFWAIQNALKDVYSANIAGRDEPTPHHIKNGLINIPGTDAAGTTVGWSIVNFFNTHPLVRKILIGEYEKYINNNNLPCRFMIREFTDWVRDNKYDIFGSGSEVFNRMVKSNQSTWANGQRNETASMSYLEDFYGDDWSILSDSEPGIRKDALGGIDMSMVNLKTGEERTFQAKALSNVEEIGDGRWKVNSGWLHHYPKDTVHYYIFTNANQEKSYIFKNQGQYPESGGNSMIFNYPPL